ncbi:DMT family transporter [Nocardia sp. CDC160]|uniref:DMT family transporter n=1 Tax=Nocardia sp. CDC160 TaxID=3112166 RepID=UPI002DB67A79|nr:DMT family transporter [Nocardia sp. CDC160]MEC3916081.1 DMT family transporter [Nocardia sp. CDC160]
MNRTIWLELGVLSAAWGLAYPVTAIALRSFPPVVVVATRTLLAAAILIPIAVHRREFPDLTRCPGRILAIGLVQSAMPLLLLTYGLQFLPTGLSAILIGFQPLWMIALAPNERPRHPSGLIGLLIGFVGLAMVVGFDVAGSIGALFGGALVIGASLSYAVGALLVERHLAHIPPLGMAATTLSTTAVVMLIPGIHLFPQDRLPEQAPLMALLALGTMLTAAPLVLYYHLIARANASIAALAWYLSPAVSVMVGWLFRHEPLTHTTLIGLLAVVTGSALAARSAPPTTAELNPVLD